MNGKSLKIAIYSGEIPSTTFIERLIEGLSEKGHQIYLFGAKKHSVSYSSSVKVLGYRNSKLFKGFYLLKYWLLLSILKPKQKKRLDVILKESGKDDWYTKVKSYPILYHNPTIFHIQWAKGLSDWLWVQEFGMKIVLSLRGAHINYSPLASPELTKMYETNFPKVDAFHAVSNAIAQEAVRYNAPNDKITVVYSGLDLKASRTLSEKHRDVFKIISVGRSHWIKGYYSALDCCSILKQKGFDFSYTIVGADDSIELKYQRVDLGLEEEVVLLEKMPFSSVKTALLNSDLLLLPSLKEGIANVALEAMALGVPVLTTKCGGMEEVIKDMENGFVCSVRNPKAMSEKVLEISKLSKDTLEDIIKNAKQTIKDQHQVEHMVTGMEELYKSV